MGDVDYCLKLVSYPSTSLLITFSCFDKLKKCHEPPNGNCSLYLIMMDESFLSDPYKSLINQWFLAQGNK